MTKKQTIGTELKNILFEKPPALRFYFIIAAFVLSVTSLIPLCLIFSPDEIIYIIPTLSMNKAEVELMHLLSNIRFSDNDMLRLDAAMYVFGDNAAKSLETIMNFLEYSVYSLVCIALFYYSGISGKIKMPNLKIPGILYIYITAAIFAVVAYYLGHVTRGHIPEINDELAQLFHAEAVAAGKWFHTPIKNIDFFNITYTFVTEGRWISQYPPGHILLLALGVLIGNPALINPVLSGITVICVFFLTRRLYDEKTAFISAIILCLSPMFLKYSLGYMNSVSSGLSAAVFYLMFIKSVTDGNKRHFFLCGLAIGFLFIIRPYTAVAIGFPYALFLLYDCFIKKHSALKSGIICFTGFAAVAWFYFYYNYMTTGNPLISGYEALWGPQHRPGFGETPWGKDHTFLKGILNLNNTFIDMNVFITGWPVPFMLTLIPGIYSLYVSDKRKLFFVMSPVISLLIFNIFYFYYELRFVYELLPLLVPFAVYGVAEFFKIGKRLDLALLKPRQAGIFIILMTLSAVVYVDYKVIFKPQTPSTVPFLYQQLQSYNLQNALVFMNSNYQAVETLVPFPDNAQVIYARDLGPRNKELIAQYPNRTVYYEREGRITKAD